jgi:hypothetical protein
VGYLLQKEGATEAQTTFFINEFQVSTYGKNGSNPPDKKIWNASRTWIELRKGTGGNMRHYRLEFYDHAKGEFLDVVRNHHYLFTINKVRSEGHINITEAQQYPGSNLEYTIYVDDDSQSVTSNGQYAVVTNVDTVKIPGDVTVPQKVATYRYINPAGLYINPDGAKMYTDTIIVEPGSIQPPGATLTVSAPGMNAAHDPIGNPIITTTNRDLEITTGGGLTEAVILIKYTNITHRLPVKKI